MTGNEKRKKKRYAKRVKKRQQKRDIQVGKYDDITGVIHPDALFDAFHACEKGVAWKASTQKCHYNLLFEISDSYEALSLRKSIQKGYYCFDLMERGKKRNISSVHITERFVQRSLCDNALMPVCGRSILYSNCASIQGAGIKRSEQVLVKQLRKYYKKNKNNGYIVLFDAKSYFDSIPHKVIIADMANLFYDPDIIRLYQELTNSFDTIHPAWQKGRGLGLGSQSSQISGVMAANAVDHFVAEFPLGYGNGRFMDDSEVIVKDKISARLAIKAVSILYNRYGLMLNKKKTKAVPLNHPFIFLKRKVIVRDSGKIIMTPTAATIKRERKRLRLHKRYLMEKRMTAEEIREQYISFRRQNEKYSCAKALWRLDKYYGFLFSGNADMMLKKEEKKKKRKKDKMETKKQMLMKQYPEHVIIMIEGMFYVARGTSARILSTLTGYKLKNIGNGKVRCGFPPQSMSRVEKMFARAHINYVIYSGDLMEAHGEFPDNAFRLFTDRVDSGRIKKEEPPVIPVPGDNKNVPSVRPANTEPVDPLIEFLENLEIGKHPFFGGCSDTLDLGDKEIQKYFHEIKMKLKSVSKNEKWDW